MSVITRALTDSPAPTPIITDIGIDATHAYFLETTKIDMIPNIAGMISNGFAPEKKGVKRLFKVFMPVITEWPITIEVYVYSPKRNNGFSPYSRLNEHIVIKADIHIQGSVDIMAPHPFL
jgi:hypothetical protein